MTGTMKWILAVLLLGAVLGMNKFAHSAPGSDRNVNTWLNLIDQAEALHLPTGFLKEIDPDFVTVTFEDLRTYAAEYHPEDHRMILNLRLSFNKAGGALMDLERMTHHDVSLLYHELLHSYLDYIFNGPGPGKLSPQANHVLSFAREQMRCHYRFVRHQSDSPAEGHDGNPVSFPRGFVGGIERNLGGLCRMANLDETGTAEQWDRPMERSLD